MTATRWWVRRAARWMARLEAAAPMIKMGSLVMTGLSTALITLNQYGYGHYALPFLLVGSVIGVTFVKYYSEGGVYNQQKRDVRDLGQNFAAPNQRIDDEMISRGIVSGQKGRQLSQEEREAVSNELDKAFVDLRDGIKIDQVGSESD